MVVIMVLLVPHYGQAVVVVGLALVPLVILMAQAVLVILVVFRVQLHTMLQVAVAAGAKPPVVL